MSPCVTCRDATGEHAVQGVVAEAGVNGFPLHNGGASRVAGQILVLSSDRPQKRAFLTALRRGLATAPRAVLLGETSLSPKPPWFVTSKTAARTGRLLTGFAARPRWRTLPAILASALRG
ncbi:hypothetical protein ACWC4D_41430 [Streptomyces sp. NPDC001288]|uniref:hypothetical protein n=1 Tax=Streptomyces sp. NPDC001297 TaxID=3364559 RepID=UPI00368EC7EE